MYHRLMELSSGMSDNECWLYPTERIAPSTARQAWEMHYAQPWPGGHVRHTCDNPRCFNPRHLIPGTHQENMADKAERGRAPGCVSYSRQDKIEAMKSSDPPDVVAERFGMTVRFVENLQQRWARMSPSQKLNFN